MMSLPSQSTPLERTIWKYDVEPFAGGRRMPPGARLLHVGMQGEIPRLWVEVDVNPASGVAAEPEVFRFLHVVPTGLAVPDGGIYVGSWQMIEDGTPLVFHLYDGGEDVR